MVTREDIESFLIRSEADAQEIEENIWLVLPAPAEELTDEPGIVINFAPPVVVLRMNLNHPSFDATSVCFCVGCFMFHDGASRHTRSIPCAWSSVTGFPNRSSAFASAHKRSARMTTSSAAVPSAALA